MTQSELKLSERDELDLCFYESSPEKRLLTAVLRRAVLDYFSENRVHSRHAAHWLFEQQQETKGQYFSSSWVCEQLGIKLRALNRELRRAGKSVDLEAFLQNVRNV